MYDKISKCILNFVSLFYSFYLWSCIFFLILFFVYLYYAMIDQLIITRKCSPRRCQHIFMWKFNTPQQRNCLHLCSKGELFRGCSLPILWNQMASPAYKMHIRPSDTVPVLATTQGAAHVSERKWGFVISAFKSSIAMIIQQY